MEFTKYGRTLAAAEPRMHTEGRTGATLHVASIGYDQGLTILLTGRDRTGRSFKRHASSIFAAWATMSAMWGLERAWLVEPDGRRRLLMRRPR